MFDKDFLHKLNYLYTNIHTYDKVLMQLHTNICLDLMVELITTSSSLKCDFPQENAFPIQIII